MIVLTWVGEESVGLLVVCRCPLVHRMGCARMRCVRMGRDGYMAGLDWTGLAVLHCMSLQRFLHLVVHLFVHSFESLSLSWVGISNLAVHCVASHCTKILIKGLLVHLSRSDMTDRWQSIHPSFLLLTRDNHSNNNRLK